MQPRSQSSDPPKLHRNVTQRRDAQDKRLWRQIVQEQQLNSKNELEIVREEIISEYKVSRFLITESMIEECKRRLENGESPDAYNPKLLFFTMGRLVPALRKIVASTARTRLHNAEFDRYGDWKGTDELLFVSETLHEK